MKLSGEITSGMYGSWRLALGDAGGFAYFNATRDGFWRSFLAMALVAPLFGGLLLLRYYREMDSVAPLRFFSVQAISYVVAWVIFPLLMFYVVQKIDRESRFFGYIAAYNWSSVIQNAVYIPLAIVAEMGWLPPDLINFLGFIVLVSVFAYTWFIARVGLNVNFAIAATIAGGDFILSIVLNSITEALLHAT